jgi:hypothetical protein
MLLLIVQSSYLIRQTLKDLTHLTLRRPMTSLFCNIYSTYPFS